MHKKTTYRLVFLWLLVGIVAYLFNIQQVGGSGNIYIKADGSIDPLTAPIQRSGDRYTFINDIGGSIIVEKDNIVIDGAGYALQGTGVEAGIDLSSRTNVTIRNMAIKTFNEALYLHSSNQITISGTNITNSIEGIRVSNSSNNSIYGNNITGNTYEGIYILTSSNNTISENKITANTGDGVYLWGSSNNTISGNNITNNLWGITSYYSTNNNKFFHNNFLNNTSQAYIESSIDIWNEGYPSGGNYWSDYNGTDANQDGIGDTPYVIDPSNQDQYPLMKPFSQPELLTDLNKDGKVNIVDISLVAQAFSSFPGSTRWNPICDIDHNDIINIVDISMVARDFGKTS